jgi:hypothetical protein
MRIGAVNRYDVTATSLTATTAATALPVSATQNPDRSHIWRSTTNVSEDAIDIDLGSVLATTMIAVANVRLKSGGLLKLQERGDAATPGAASDVVTLPTEDAGTRVAIATVGENHRHWRLLWTNPGAVSDFAELGYAYLGTPTTPPKNPSLPVAWDLVDPSVRQQSLDGQVTSTQRSQFRAGTFRWAGLARADRDAIVETIYGAHGSHAPIFVEVQDNPTWEAILLRFGQDARTNLIAVAKHAVEVGWEEVR